jgi:putative DNA primase/helicase
VVFTPNIGSVKLEHAPRLADFVKWTTAAESGLGWEVGSFQKLYTANRQNEMEASFEADSVAVGVCDLVTLKHADGFEGTATQLLAELNTVVSDSVKKQKLWPSNAAQLGNRVSRAMPALKAKGCVVERRHSGTRTITIRRPAVILD